MEERKPASSAGAAPDIDHARGCAVCGIPRAPFGFGLPLTRGPYLWACREHHAEVERQLIPDVEQPQQLALF